MGRLSWVGLLVMAGATAALCQAPAVDPAVGVQNAGTYQPGAVAPGSFVAIFGTNFASAFAAADTIPLSTSALGGVSVTFGGVPAPMVAVGHNTTASHDDQINAQMPWNITPTGNPPTVPVVVTANGVPSAPMNVQITTAAPGLMIVNQDSAGILRPVAYNQPDFTLAYPPTAFPGGLPARPAKINDPNTLVLLATGLGPVTFTPPNGSPPIQNGQFVESDTLTKPIVTVGGVAANVVFSGLSPQFPSLYQLNIIIAPGTPTGNAVPVIIQMNGLQSRSDLMIAVSQ